jgi:hypothetical protein
MISKETVTALINEVITASKTRDEHASNLTQQHLLSEYNSMELHLPRQVGKSAVIRQLVTDIEQPVILIFSNYQMKKEFLKQPLPENVTVYTLNDLAMEMTHAWVGKKIDPKSFFVLDEVKLKTFATTDFWAYHKPRFTQLKPSTQPFFVSILTKLINF